MNKNYPPSAFSAAGIPYCSCWGRIQTETLAWAYVTALSRDGDTWHKITPERCFELLDCDERESLKQYLPNLFGRYIEAWEEMGEKFKDSNGAFDVGGMAWNRNVLERNGNKNERGN